MEKCIEEGEGCALTAQVADHPLHPPRPWPHATAKRRQKAKHRLSSHFPTRGPTNVSNGRTEETHKRTEWKGEMEEEKKHAKNSYHGIHKLDAALQLWPGITVLTE